MTNALRFDSERHEYWLGADRLPSVSEIIAPIVDLSGIPEDRLEFARDRGRAVHHACHLDHAGRLDERTLDPEHVAPYLRAYRAWRDECRVRVHLSEHPLSSRPHWFAGTPDQLVEMDLHHGTSKPLRRSAVVDIKAVAQMRPATGVQLAGYALLAHEHGFAADARIGLQLFKDGTYRIHTYGNETPTFLSLLNIWRWRQKHG